MRTCCCFLGFFLRSGSFNAGAAACGDIKRAANACMHACMHACMRALGVVCLKHWGCVNALKRRKGLVCMHKEVTGRVLLCLCCFLMVLYTEV